MSRRVLNALFAYSVFATSAASAVALNPRGVGQVLIYPYYTVNAGQDTLFTLVNATDTAKVARVRFLEGYNGRTVFATYVFLSAHDVWTAAITEVADDDGAKLATADASCTFPPLPTHAAPFTSEDYTGANDDTGPTSITRTREGEIEVIEAGDIVPGSAAETAITHVQTGLPGAGVPPCTFATGNGVQPIDLADLAVPSGGLTGSAAIVNVLQGTLFAYQATALVGFTDRLPVDDLTDATQPSLDGAHSGDSSRTARAYVPNGAATIVADYDNGIDAVSAVLMSDTIANEFLTAASLGASTDWVVTFPTKRYYVDESVRHTPRAPFEESFGEHIDYDNTRIRGVSRQSIEAWVYDRDEYATTTVDSDECGFPECPAQHAPDLPYQVNVFTFGENGLPHGTPSRVLGSVLSTYYRSGFGQGPLPDQGWMWFGLSIYNQALSNDAFPNDDTIILWGLPVAGFMVYNVINANAQPGVVGNYGGAFAYRAAICTNPDGATCPPGVAMMRHFR
ncbi:MAG TPA: hypothetical protein VFV97_06705 [Rhodanobacteraceae bacterium]|nr:hypothetical protein [Rhodanobacteraceae bacterium]